MKKTALNVLLTILTVIILTHYKDVKAFKNTDFGLHRHNRPLILTDAFFETDLFAESREKHLIEKYGENYQELFNRNANSVATADKIRSLFEVDKYGEAIYPKFIGGLYIDNNDYLVIQVTDNYKADKISKEYPQFQKVIETDNTIKMEYVKYSYSELEAINTAIVERFIVNKTLTHVVASYIDIVDNRVVVELLNNTEEERQIIKENIGDTSAIVFLRGEKAQATMNAGGPIPSRSCSIGYRARKTSVGQGFVTAGHCVSQNLFVINFGLVQNRQIGGNIDAAWLDSAIVFGTPLNTFHSYSGTTSPAVPLSTTVATSFTAGQRIGKVGMATGHQTCKIIIPNWSGFVRVGNQDIYFTRQVYTDVLQRKGDSGGIVYIPPATNLGISLIYPTAGIGNFKSSNDEMMFTRADLINSTFGLSRY